MTNLSKYRKISIVVVISMTTAWLMSLVAIWNSLLMSHVKHEGWLVLFMVLVFLAGGFLFYVAYKATDSERVEQLVKQAFESGRNMLVQELEKKKQAETEQQVIAEDTQKIAESVLSGLQNLRSANSLFNKLLGNLAREIGFVQGVLYVKNKKEDTYTPVGEYALTERKPQPFKAGETLPGQAVLNKSLMVIYDIPENYFIVSSGLGSSQPRYLILAPVLFNDEPIAVLELAAFKKPDESTTRILDKVLSEVGLKINKFITA